MTAGAADPQRRAQLEAALSAVRARISAACAAAGRAPGDIGLIAVTKFHPASDVAALAELGVRDIGESKDQEARAKIAELGGPPYVPVELRWHVVGQLQTNKARSVVGYAHAVHSVDRVRLAGALADAAEREQRPDPLDVFVQVSLDGDPGRGGVAIAELDALADAIATRPQLRLRGLMAVPPLGTDSDAAFARLAELSEGVRTQHPSVDAMSAGMSDDLEAAIRNGSTYVRVGTALLGRRPQVFG